MLSTLALDIGDVIMIAFAIVIMFGSWIANAIKTYSDKQKARQRVEQQKANRGSNLDELAAQRREQLRAMAQQQYKQAELTRPGSEGEPTNLTMAERIARARAKAQYQERADELRRQSRGQPLTTAAKREQAEAQRQRDREAAQAAQRQAEAERVRRLQQEAEQRRHQQQLRAQAQARSQQQASQRAAPQVPRTGRAPTAGRSGGAAGRRTTPRTTTARPTGRRRPTVGPTTMRVQPPHKPIDAGESVVHRHVANVEAIKAPHRGPSKSLLATLSSRQSLRDAIALKEILDKPIALRETDELSL